MARSKNQQQDSSDEQAQQETGERTQQSTQVDGSETITSENIGQDQKYAEQLQADAEQAHKQTLKDNQDPMLESVNYEKNKGAEADDA